MLPRCHISNCVFRISVCGVLKQIHIFQLPRYKLRVDGQPCPGHEQQLCQPFHLWNLQCKAYEQIIVDNTSPQVNRGHVDMSLLFYRLEEVVTVAIVRLPTLDIILRNIYQCPHTHAIWDMNWNSFSQEKFQHEFRRKLSGGCLRRTPSTMAATMARGGPAAGANSEAITPNMAGGRQVPISREMGTKFRYVLHWQHLMWQLIKGWTQPLLNM